MSSLVITVKSGRSSTDLAQRFNRDTASPREQALALADYFKAMAAGVESGAVHVGYSSSNPVAASGTFTLSSVPADDTVVIAGTTLTAKASPANENEWSQAGSDTVDAAALAAKINAHSTLSKLVSASSSGAVVTVTALQKGIIGNQITISETGSSITASGSALSGGTGGCESDDKSYGLGLA